MKYSPDETRARILEAALDLFSRSGYNAAGVAEICQRAGVSKGAFYHHFPSKHAVFMNLLEAWLGQLQPGIEMQLASAPDIPSGLTAMTSLAPAVFSQAENRLPLFLEFWTQASRDPAVWEATVAPYRQFLELFSGYMQRGVDEGSLNRIDPPTASRTVLALVLGIILQRMMDPQSADWGRTMLDGMDLLMKGMQRRNP